MRIIKDDQKIVCNHCNGDDLQRNGYKSGKQKYRCKNCSKEGIIPNSFHLVPVDENSTVTNPKTMTNSIGITIAEFREKHDLNFIVNKVLKALDRQHLYEKTDIAKLCKLNPTYPGLRSTLEETKEFEPYRGRVAGRFYWGHPDIVSQLKNEGQLT